MKRSFHPAEWREQKSHNSLCNCVRVCLCVCILVNMTPWGREWFQSTAWRHSDPGVAHRPILPTKTVANCWSCEDFEILQQVKDSQKTARDVTWRNSYELNYKPKNMLLIWTSGGGLSCWSVFVLFLRRPPLTLCVVPQLLLSYQWNVITQKNVTLLVTLFVCFEMKQMLYIVFCNIVTSGNAALHCTYGTTHLQFKALFLAAFCRRVLQAGLGLSQLHGFPHCASAV